MILTISDRTKSGLVKIPSYFRLLNFKSAKSLDARFRDRIASLAIFPERGLVRPELGSDIGVLLVGVYLLIYPITADENVILWVIDGRLDVEAEFRE